jgi:putative FmdB family regulatory protein
LPIYEYECTSCGKHFENMQKITEDPINSCPFCNGKVKKLVSNCSFQLKGTGWYVTDYGNGRKPEGKEGKQEEKKEAKKEEKKEARKGEKKEARKEKGKDTGTAKETAVNQ